MNKITVNIFQTIYLNLKIANLFNRDLQVKVCFFQ